LVKALIAVEVLMIAAKVELHVCFTFIPSLMIPVGVLVARFCVLP
jgi:hypothetical protein